MSAQAIVDLALAPQILPGDIEAVANLQQQSAMVASPHHLTQVNQVLQDYGFRGTGQTVVVIDSGIAWDHYALGGGFGAGHRVVGGWDFAENDANPYDDGSAGFHGTHVSGIIGSSDSEFKGVASGVDLVGLRVFNDAGQGNLAWVEQALQWVHQNLRTFANPITTVNLSLGSAWNADTVPNWATLEEEFAQLRADGVFISVAAGNSFSSWNTAGLSYPAASEHVVPVASHDAAGNLSGFSQRNSRVLVAPGESIRSTVPDHLFGGARSGQFLGSSGTSMAAPWVAGASALLREAYGFMGQTDVNQDQLYRTFRDSADQVFDSVTGGWYSRINLEKAIASVVSDIHGDTAASATSLGTIHQGMVVEGTIGKTSDVDAFGFTAGRSGRMTLSFETTHEMQAHVRMFGGSAQWSGNSVSFDVQAGQQYKFAVSTADGIGHYRMKAEISGSLAGNWGVIEDTQRSGIQVNGSAQYEIQASREGLVTVCGRATSGTVNYRLLDQNMQEVHAGVMGSGGMRFDFTASAGEKFRLQLDGAGSADFRLTNLVSLQQGKLSVHGTAGQDRMEIQTGGQWSVEVNGIAYRFSGSDVHQVLLDGQGGHDQFHLRLGNGNHQVHIAPNSVWVGGNGFSMAGKGLETAVVHAGSGYNQLALFGSAGSDSLANSGDMVSLAGTGYSWHGIGFSVNYADGRGGYDSAGIQGTAGADRIGVGDGWFSLSAGNTSLFAVKYEQIRFSGGGGIDQVNFQGSSGNDHFAAGNFRASAQIGGANFAADEVESVSALGRGGYDTMTWNDTAANDSFYSGGRNSSISGGGFSGHSAGMSVIHANSTAGNDLAQLAGTDGNDQVWMSEPQSVVVNASGRTTTAGFARTNIIAGGGGADSVRMYGGSGNDSIYSTHDATSLQLASGRLNRAVGFGSVIVDGWSGNDSAHILGSNGLDRLSATSSVIELNRGQGGHLQIGNIRSMTFDGQLGADEVVFAELGTGDELTGAGGAAVARYGGRVIEARNFAFLAAQAHSGQTATEGLREVDYLFMLSGQWQPRQ